METGQTGRRRDTTQRDKHRDRTTNILTRQDRERREPPKQDSETRQTREHDQRDKGQHGDKTGTDRTQDGHSHNKTRNQKVGI